MKISKKIKLMILSFVLLVVAFIIFTFVFPANKVPIQFKKATPENETSSSAPITPTLSPLEQIKEQASSGYNISEKVNIEYQRNSDSFVVFYSGAKETAQKEVASFFQKFNLTQTNTIKINYIGTDRGTTEPPPGFGQ